MAITRTGIELAEIARGQFDLAAAKAIAELLPKAELKEIQLLGPFPTPQGIRMAKQETLWQEVKSGPT